MPDDAPSNWFRRRREALKLTIREMADLCFVREGSVANWEHGRSAPQSNTAPDLASAYQVTQEAVGKEIIRLSVQVRRAKEGGK